MSTTEHTLAPTEESSPTVRNAAILERLDRALAILERLEPLLDAIEANPMVKSMMGA